MWSHNKKEFNYSILFVFYYDAFIIISLQNNDTRENIRFNNNNCKKCYITRYDFFAIL